MRGSTNGGRSMAAEVWRDGRVDDQPDEGLGRREPASQEDVCRDE